MRPGLWIGLFLAGAGVIAALRLTEAINGSTGFILFAGVCALLIPFARSVGRRGPGRAGTAIARYTKGIVASALLYVLGLGLAMTLDRRMELEGATAFLVALMPVLPILWMIYVVGRYLVEEPDEYLRYRAMVASLAGLGLVLAVGSFWGFLETFGLVVHVPGWWAVPIWAFGMGMGQLWLALRDRTGGEE
ncbi:hypothetical protein [Croceibacterium aestuarii]|uniref:hypothetical protein n=1 Tax=Croceibacterium aestuarii TaxID=3064139 RepID=UPI00272E143F|nr:hypothetical protein [Croceibacterium sp. D39]